LLVLAYFPLVFLITFGLKIVVNKTVKPKNFVLQHFLLTARMIKPNSKVSNILILF